MRTLNVVLLEEAGGELELGRRFYEEKESGTGRYFAAACQFCLPRI